MTMMMATSVSGAERGQDDQDPGAGSRQMSASTPGTLMMFGSSSISSLDSSSTGRRERIDDRQSVFKVLSYLFENIPKLLHKSDKMKKKFSYLPL